MNHANHCGHTRHDEYNADDTQRMHVPRSAQQPDCYRNCDGYRKPWRQLIGVERVVVRCSVNNHHECGYQWSPRTAKNHPCEVCAGTRNHQPRCSKRAEPTLQRIDEHQLASDGVQRMQNVGVVNRIRELHRPLNEWIAVGKTVLNQESNPSNMHARIVVEDGSNTLRKDKIDQHHRAGNTDDRHDSVSATHPGTSTQ